MSKDYFNFWRIIKEYLFYEIKIINKNSELKIRLSSFMKF